MNSPGSPSFPEAGASRWRLLRRLLLAAAALVTLIAVFYTVENWRGQRAWESRRRQLEAKGEVLDWSAYIPPPIPDDQNFFKAPQMQEWFVKDSMKDLSSSRQTSTAGTPDPLNVAPRTDVDLILAEVEVALPQAPAGFSSPDAVLSLDDLSASEQAEKLLSQALGPWVIGARQCVLVAKPLEHFNPLHLVLRASGMPTLKDVAAFFPTNLPFNAPFSFHQTSYLQVGPSGSNGFVVVLKKPVYGAADYLEWTEPSTAFFDLTRKALERPYARIDCDYQQPYAIGIPNFVRMRQAVQLLAERAQSYLLLGQPEAAWRELALIPDLSGIVLAKPSGKPITLVAAMIHVAITGLYASIVQDGLRLHAWKEPQLLAIERQIKQIDLLAPVAQAFREERAATSHTFESTPRGELVKLFQPDPGLKAAFTWAPHGWFYQNMAFGAEMEQDVLEALDPTNQLVVPGRLSQIVNRLVSPQAQRSPYSFLVAIALPNFAKAVRVAARNQTMLNQVRIGCALEHYRLVYGEYPETLDALVPTLMEKPLPHDLIGGRPLNYRRTNQKGYLIYSVGWDERDNGGTPGKSPDEGDWVWEIP